MPLTYDWTTRLSVAHALWSGGEQANEDGRTGQCLSAHGAGVSQRVLPHRTVGGGEPGLPKEERCRPARVLRHPFSLEHAVVSEPCPRVERVILAGDGAHVVDQQRKSVRADFIAHDADVLR